MHTRAWGLFYKLFMLLKLTATVLLESLKVCQQLYMCGSNGISYEQGKVCFQDFANVWQLCESNQQGAVLWSSQGKPRGGMGELRDYIWNRISACGNVWW